MAVPEDDNTAAGMQELKIEDEEENSGEGEASLKQKPSSRSNADMILEARGKERVRGGTGKI